MTPALRIGRRRRRTPDIPLALIPAPRLTTWPLRAAAGAGLLGGTWWALKHPAAQRLDVRADLRRVNATRAAAAAGGGVTTAPFDPDTP